MRKLVGMVSGETITLAVKENQIACRIGETIMVSRLIDGNFPNYTQVIPKKHDIAITLPKEPFMAATRRVALLAITLENEKGTPNAVKYVFKKNKVSIFASSQGIGEADDEIEIDYAGPEVEMAYNPGFVTDVLRNISEDQFVLELTTPLNPCVFRPAADASYICVIMPIRTAS